MQCVTFNILHDCALEFDILQFRWNSLALFPVIVWGIHILTLPARGGGRQEESKIGTHKESINYFCWGVVQLGFLFLFLFE